MPKQDPLIDALRAKLDPASVLTGLTDRLARAHDASIYRLVPRAVVRPRGIADVQAILEVARAQRVGVTFRAGGTSLSGQAVTDGILVELGFDWRRATPSADGATITSQPGVNGGRLNALLLRYGRRIGPDPASLAAAMIGGIVANNASGMCCGTHANSYQTLVGMQLVLADGFVIDTRAADAAATLERERPALHRGLAELRARVLAKPELVATIRRKYAIKNTMGYSLNSLVDFERPLDILAHLLVGSEGTLGFIGEVTLKTVVEHKHQATALAYFADLREAGAAVEPLAKAGAAVVEIMDRQSMAALQSEMAYPFALSDRCAALLIEFQEDDAATLAARIAECGHLLAPFSLLAPLEFTADSKRRAHFWKLRKGLFPKIGGERPLGTAVIIEDICLPRARLAEAIGDLRALFVEHGFAQAVIFGHAKDGNLHFVLCHDFSSEAAIQQYAGLMEGLAALVVDRYQGSLKAEHGTGRNMAPFVRQEWGDDLFEVMRAVKRLLDPDGILNPGVLLTDDPQAHLRDLKTLPAVAPLVDRCIECGFCERVCPSRDLTLTPRQRIALQREVGLHTGAARRQIEKEYAYAGVDTCAGDGLCATVCPVGIDTGAYMRALRAKRHGGLARSVAALAARHFAWLAVFARWGLRVATWLRLPLFPKRIPAPRAAESWHLSTSAAAGRPRVVFFSACLTQVLGGAREGAVVDGSAPARVLDACGFEVRPASGSAVCCGQPFQSKGFPDAARLSAQAWIDQLWIASEAGAHPIVCDTSPCTARLHGLEAELTDSYLERWRKLRIFDFPTFMAREVLPTRATWPKLSRRLVLHPTCSTIKSEAVQDLVAVAKAFASEVSLPVSAGCCGFAGDKGFQVPELTLSATREEGREVRALADEHGPNLTAYSTCQTCSLGMKAATGLDYQPIAKLCLEALQGANRH